MKKFLTLMLFLAAFNSVAAVNCRGKISNVYVGVDGQVVLFTSWRNAYHTVCSVNGEWKGVSVDVCKSWLSIAQTAQVSKTDTIMRYQLNACNEVGIYNAAPAPSYLMLYGLSF
ncbi:hypothetical protein EYS14_21575 [Alteromonadaceae bacterium M269]|nr:hypothetical protein EYS14_21575 [Alteromonadaceae bacterium M269]